MPTASHAQSSASAASAAPLTPDLAAHIARLREVCTRDYTAMFREAGGALKHPFIVPGSAQYLDQLWDWDSWLTNVALRQIVADLPATEGPAAAAKMRPYERGCVLNFLADTGWHGWVPIMATRAGETPPPDRYATNMHKPCLAQHAAFLVQQDGGDAEWLREAFYSLQTFLNNYRSHHRHAPTGLYYWQDDCAIGVDNDPCTYGRPPRSSASIYLNCLMYRELLATVYLAERLGQPEVAATWQCEAEALRTAVQTHCWDEWTGSFYSVDINIGANHSAPGYLGMPRHAGMPLHWSCLIQRVGVWSNFLALWADLASPEQALRMAREHLADPRTFAAPAGVRTLSKLEKMYDIRASGNPSSWLGPVWIVANYLVWRGVLRHGLIAEATELCDRTIRLLGRDVERFGAMHEYYAPESGEPLLNRGFQNWNYLVLNMAAWREGRPVVAEF
jgi:putative isomerase